MFFDVKMQLFFGSAKNLLKVRGLTGLTRSVRCFSGSTNALISRDVCRLERELDLIDEKKEREGCGEKPEIEWGCSGPRVSVESKLIQPQRTFGLLQTGTPLSSTLWYPSEVERSVAWNSMNFSRKKMMLFVDKILYYSNGGDENDIVISLNDHQTDKIFGPETEQILG